jgi:hypothetical protein
LDLLVPNQAHYQAVLYSVKWCPWRESNPHSFELEPKSSVSTNFTTWAISNPPGCAHYVSVEGVVKWCRYTDSNRGPTDYKSVALPTVLYRLYLLTLQTGQKSSCPSSLLHSLHVFIQYLYYGADDQVRTDDIGLGRTALYQLSYIRLKMCTNTKSELCSNVSTKQT